MSGVIVLTLFVCVHVSLSVHQSRSPNRQTYRPEFWHGCQVDGYLGQISRLRSKLKGQGHLDV